MNPPHIENHIFQVELYFVFTVDVPVVEDVLLENVELNQNDNPSTQTTPPPVNLASPTCNLLEGQAIATSAYLTHPNTPTGMLLRE